MPAEDEPYQDALVLAGFSLPALVLIWIVSSWSLRPLARISQEARKIGPGNPVARLSAFGLPTEIVPLVEAVDDALDRMASAFEAERRFTQNAAHELRTPLTVLGLRLQRARQSGADAAALDWAAIDADLAQMNRLVGQLLDLARKENAGRTRRGQARPVVNVARIAREACAAILPLAEAQGRTLTITTPDTLPAQGDADDLRDALRNLLENALLHGRGHIDVDGRLDSGSGQIRLYVSDEGAGFDAASTRTVFERFNKASLSTGMGLGLAIAREVLLSHGGDLRALQGPPGRIEMYLPGA